MQCYLFWASFILLLGLSASQGPSASVPCKEARDCANLQGAPPNITCSEGFCKCPLENGTMVNCASINTNSSSPSAGIVVDLIGHFCSLDKDCVGDVNAFCNTTNKQCACKSGFISNVNKTECLPVVRYLMSGCQINKQCFIATPNTTCVNHVCQCEDNFHFLDTACWVKIGFGSKCNVSQECGHVQGAVCSSLNLCSCPENTVIASDARSCLPKSARISDICIESIQCTALLGQNGVCQANRCGCREQHHHSIETNTCIISKQLNDACEMDHECLNGLNVTDASAMRCLTTSVSTKKACVCPEKTRYDNSLAKCVSDGSSDANRALVNLAAFSMALAYFVVHF